MQRLLSGLGWFLFSSNQGFANLFWNLKLIKFQRIDEGGQLAKACREELCDEVYLERLVWYFNNQQLFIFLYLSFCLERLLWTCLSFLSVFLYEFDNVTCFQRFVMSGSQEAWVMLSMRNFAKPGVKGTTFCQIFHTFGVASKLGYQLTHACF